MASHKFVEPLNLCGTNVLLFLLHWVESIHIQLSWVVPPLHSQGTSQNVKFIVPHKGTAGIQLGENAEGRFIVPESAGLATLL